MLILFLENSIYTSLLKTRIYLIKMILKFYNFLKNEDVYLMANMDVYNFIFFKRNGTELGTLPTNLIDLDFRQIHYTKKIIRMCIFI